MRTVLMLVLSFAAADAFPGGCGCGSGSRYRPPQPAVTVQNATVSPRYTALRVRIGDTIVEGPIASGDGKSIAPPAAPVHDRALVLAYVGSTDKRVVLRTKRAFDLGKESAFTLVLADYDLESKCTGLSREDYAAISASFGDAGVLPYDEVTCP